MQNQDINARSEILIGKDKIESLSSKKIAVIGCGGVGSIIPLVLAMSNIGNILLIDQDKIDITNLNRQIAYNFEDIGEDKVYSLKEKVVKKRPNINVIALNKRIDFDFDFSVLNDCAFVIDCIDDINAKVLLIKYCISEKIKVVSSLGMGFKLDPSLVKIVALNKTTSDPLAKRLRYLLKKENVDLSKVIVAFSSECNLCTNREVGSMAFVPNAAGLILASYVLRELIN